MKSTQVGWRRDWISRSGVVLIAGFAMFVLAENGCGGSTDNSGDYADNNANNDQISGCFAGETLTQVGKATLCCSGTAPNLVCTAGSHVGDPCAGQVSVLPQQMLNVTLDVCVSDGCDGEHTPTTFDAKVLATTTPLACVNGALAATGQVTTQEVDRVCTAVGTPSCPSGPYGYSYGYGYGASSLVTRAVSVSSSTCSTSNDAPTPCDVGEF